ncbi:uncharacterized protein DFL_006793 [Arthrobotrys flagrans]|uniref:Protein kinase domain-containing protein n=1 Tax=Arthrobotrys flagrans TaxID=97331 RepID=A0A436ZTT0_ARTFL|nr:hypothetical protein DFL_006793 [Arthrobotrys flagrans]
MAAAVRVLDGRDPNYEFVGTLGQGVSGSIARVRRVSDGKIMACKVIDCSDNPLLVALATREIHTWSSFATSEKYIANFGHDVTWTERTKTMRLYMKLYADSDLQRVITGLRHQDSIIHPFMATYWAMEIATGLKACHDHGIIHRDLKPVNGELYLLLDMPYIFNEMLWESPTVGTLGQKLYIMYVAYKIMYCEIDAEKELGKQFSAWFESRPPWCHISDFGFGKFTAAAHLSGHHTKGSLGTVGTTGYLAPEVTHHEPKFSVKSDVYSFGCLVYSLCTCKPPPPIATEGGRPPEILQIYPKIFREIIAQCMEFHPDNRPNSRELANRMADAFIGIQNDRGLGDLAKSLAYSNLASVLIPEAFEGDFPLHNIFRMARAPPDDVEECARMIYNAAPYVLGFKVKMGRTPLYWAVRGAGIFGSRFVELLMDFGADPYTKDSYGYDAYHIVSPDNNFVIANLYPKVREALNRYTLPPRAVKQYSHTQTSQREEC